MTVIGSLNEKALHAALKNWSQQPGDQTEVPVAGYIIDLKRGDLLIEVQTRNFSAIKTKLFSLITDHPVRLVYPVAEQKWIVKQTTREQGKQNRRKSPHQGNLYQIFDELVSFPELLAHPHFSLQVVLIHEEEVRRYDRRRGWRRKGWVTHERRLLDVRQDHLFEKPADLHFLIPPNLSEMFTTADLAELLSLSRRRAQKIAYCLSRMKLLSKIGKRGNAVIYRRSMPE